LDQLLLFQRGESPENGGTTHTCLAGQVRDAGAAVAAVVGVVGQRQQDEPGVGWLNVGVEDVTHNRDTHRVGPSW
jgi:hypothetical protein